MGKRHKKKGEPNKHKNGRQQKDKRKQQNGNKVVQESPPKDKSNPNDGIIRGFVNFLSGAKNGAKPESEDSETSSYVEVGSSANER